MADVLSIMGDVYVFVLFTNFFKSFVHNVIMG